MRKVLTLIARSGFGLLTLYRVACHAYSTTHSHHTYRPVSTIALLSWLLFAHTVYANTLTSLQDKQLGLKQPLATITPSQPSTVYNNMQQKKSATLSLKAPLRLPYPATPQQKASASRKALQYVELVQKIANQWQQEPALVMAVIHAESYFEPQAQSPAPAYGLMQLMFDGAVAEVSRFYFDNQTFSLGQILQPETNITIGSAYLSILSQVYLRDIRSQRSRLSLTIAAYNCGLSRLMTLMANTRSLTQFASVINNMSDEAVLHYLTQQLPIAETRHYVGRVLALQKQYTELPLR